MASHKKRKLRTYKHGGPRKCGEGCQKARKKFAHNARRAAKFMKANGVSRHEAWHFVKGHVAARKAAKAAPKEQDKTYPHKFAKKLFKVRDLMKKKGMSKPEAWRTVVQNKYAEVMGMQGSSYRHRGR